MKLSDMFKCVKNTLDTTMVDRAAQGLGVPKMKDYIAEEMKEKLWKMGILGESNPNQLRNTILFLVRSRFGLRGGNEHHALCRYPTPQIQIEEVNGKRCLVYRERVSKTNQGGIQSRILVTLKVSCAFCSGYRLRCFIELFDKYQFYCPKPTRF